MIRAFLPIAVSVATAVTYRSHGYAGSTPVGLDGYVAFTNLDCARINADPRRSHVRVPLSADCVVALPSPDGRTTLRAEPQSDDTIVLKSSDGLPIVTGLEQPTVLFWNPDSSGFLLNDSEGSGQVSHLRYFRRTARGWVESRKLATAASALYRRRYDCRGGAKSYVNVSGWDWPQPGLLRVIVQEGVHSEGCLQPHANRNVLFEAVGNPMSGRISSVHEMATLP